jgi:hypothetical protein
MAQVNNGKLIPNQRQEPSPAAGSLESESAGYVSTIALIGSYLQDSSSPLLRSSALFWGG